MDLERSDTVPLTFNNLSTATTATPSWPRHPEPSINWTSSTTPALARGASSSLTMKTMARTWAGNESGFEPFQHGAFRRPQSRIRG